MEANGPKLLGSSYKDPISSLSHFYRFSVENQEVSYSKSLNYVQVKRPKKKTLRNFFLSFFSQFLIIKCDPTLLCDSFFRSTGQWC
jgi:hypothetical protein